jgi:hypothetical protein
MTNDNENETGQEYRTKLRPNRADVRRGRPADLIAGDVLVPQGGRARARPVERGPLVLWFEIMCVQICTVGFKKNNKGKYPPPYKVQFLISLAVVCLFVFHLTHVLHDDREIEGSKDTEIDCRAIRGQNGSWVPSKGYRYATPLLENAGKKDRQQANHTTFFPETQWEWTDVSSQQCPFNLLTKGGMCYTMKQLQLDRIFFVGDSLSYMMVQSFWKLLGHSDDPGDQFRGLTRTVDCESDYSFEMIYKRNDYLRNDLVYTPIDKIGHKG